MRLLASLLILQICIAEFGRGILGGSNVRKSGARGAESLFQSNQPVRGSTVRQRPQESDTRTQSGDKKVTASHGEDTVTAEKVLKDKDEAFAPLQVLVEVNGFMVPAIIDTGAQITVMSASCAKRCHISGSIDTRFSGRAVGVGSSDILGRIDGLGMRVGPVSFDGKVSILREARVDFLIGLDTLKRFQAEVNLKEHVLKLQVRDRQYRVPLLHKHADLEVLPAGSSGFIPQASNLAAGLEDPDYYESEFPEEEVVEQVATMPTFQHSTPTTSYKSLDSYRSSSSSKDVSKSGSVRSKEPALSLEGV